MPGSGLPAAPGSTQHSDRSCTAAETFSRIAPLLPLYGITRLARLTDLDRLGIPVWNAVAPNARSITINQGKGITNIDAKVSAAMEALERAVAGRPEIETIQCSVKSLIEAGKRAECLSGLIAAGQDDIDPDETIDWVIGTELIGGQPTYVPHQAVLLDRTVVGCRFWQSSDGLASGNTFEEATLHGLLERIERDACVLWQIDGSEGRVADAIDLASLREPVIDDMATKIESAGLILKLFDITSDIRIPCYSALLGPANLPDRKTARFFDVTLGSGAHPNPVRAALRAITEAAQSRLTFISGARDDIHPDTFDLPLPDHIRRHLTAPATQGSIAMPDVPQGAQVLLAHTIERLTGAGIKQAIAVRLTTEASAFAVAKIFVPQLENPDGARRRRVGARALSRSLGIV